MNKKINPNLRKLVQLTHNPNLKTDESIFEKQRAQPSFKVPIENYFFLGKDLGKEIHAKIVSKYPDNPFVTRDIEYVDGIVKGSKPGYIVAVNEMLPEGFRPATSGDVGKIIKEDKLDLRNHYEDLGLVLMSEDEPNKYLGQDLAKQIRQRKPDFKFPILLNLSSLELRVDNNSPYNLAFQLTDKSQIIYAPQLEYKNDDEKFSETDENGLPIFDKGGDKTLYTTEKGLRVLFRNRLLDLNARGRSLVDSFSDGRVIICAEGTRAKKSVGVKK